MMRKAVKILNQEGVLPKQYSKIVKQEIRAARALLKNLGNTTESTGCQFS